MSENSPFLNLPLIQPAQAQKHVTHNEAVMQLDLLVQLAVLNRTLTAPPATPAEGDRHIVAAPATGAWAGHAGDIAYFQDGAWQFMAPLTGFAAYVAAEAAVASYDGAAWATLADGVLEVGQLGVGTSPDATNRLAVASPASLFTHDGAGHQLKVNKAAASDTASLVFQTGFSGRAEMGTVGADQFQIRVSDTGASFATALEADGATGRVRLPGGVRSDGFALHDATDPTKQAAFALSGLTAGASRSYALPDASGEIALLTGTQTFTGAKTFSGNVTFSGAQTIVDSGLTIQDDADATKKTQFQLSGITTGATRVLTVPDVSGEIALLTGTQTFTGAKTFSGNVTFSGAQTIVDSGLTIQDDVDATKKTQFQLSGITTGATRVLSVPDASGEIALLTGTQTFTGTKTFSGNVVFSGAQTIIDSGLTLQDDLDATKKAQFQLSSITTGTTRTLTLPDANGTLAVLNAQQQFTSQQTFSGANNFFGISTSTGTTTLGSGATLSGSTKTVNIGTGGVSGSTTNIAIGSAVSGALGSLTISSPTVTFGTSVSAVAMASANLSALYLGLGGATADATNRLSVNSPAVLLNHAGASMEATLNKAAAANDASLAFKTGFSARALIGLLGNDDFTFKVSADGSSYTSALTIAAAGGQATLAAPMVLSGQASDPASPVNGMLWHNSTSGQLKARLGGSTVVLNGGGGGGVSDGDKGDVVVSGSGAVWALDYAAVNPVVAPVWTNVTAKPTTLAGYGITDAAALAGDQTLAGIKTFSAAPVLAGVTSDPASPANGSVWHRSDTGQIKAQVGGVTKIIDGQSDLPCLIPAAAEFLLTTTGASSGSTGTLAGVADRMDIFPFVPRADLAIDQMVVNVTTLIASATGKIVLYAADANGRPATLITETGTLDFSTTGAKAASYSTTLRQGVTYWLGIRHSSTATLSTWTTAATPDINGGTAIATTARKVLRRSLAYATAAPSTWGYTSTEINAAAATAIWLRKA